jgi:hypothetical protein
VNRSSDKKRRKGVVTIYRNQYPRHNGRAQEASEDGQESIVRFHMVASPSESGSVCVKQHFHFSWSSYLITLPHFQQRTCDKD